MSFTTQDLLLGKGQFFLGCRGREAERGKFSGLSRTGGWEGKVFEGVEDGRVRGEVFWGVGDGRLRGRERFITKDGGLESVAERCYN